MPDAKNRRQRRAGPSRHRALPTAPQPPSSDVTVDITRLTPANPPNPRPRAPWRRHLRPDSPHPRQTRTPLPPPQFTRPESEEETGYDTGSDILTDNDTDNEESLPSEEGEVPSLIGSPGWDRVAAHLEGPGPTEQMLEYYGSDEDVQNEGSESSTSWDRSPGANPMRLADYVSVASLVSTVPDPSDLDVGPPTPAQQSVNTSPRSSTQATPSGILGIADRHPPMQPRRNIHNAAPSQPIPSEASTPDDQPPPLQREQSRVTNVSFSTNIETPAHPSVPLPNEPPMSLAQQVWRHRKIRKRIMSHMDLSTLATMCRVNRRMYEQAIHRLARAMDLLTLVRTLDRIPLHGSAWRVRAFLGSVRQLKIRPRHAISSWSELRTLCPGLRTIVFLARKPEGNVVVQTTLQKQPRISRYGRRTIIICHVQSRDINVLRSWPHLLPPIDITPDYQIIHRYEFLADIPHLYSTIPDGRLNDFSPLGDQISAITMLNPTLFSFAYEQVKRCVEKRRCPRGFTWGHVRLRVWRITISELRMMLELLQASHLTICNLVIDTEFRDKGTVSTQDFVKAGPSLWRLLGKFENVSLSFRHENEPMPMAGKGPKGLSAFMKNEPLNLVSLTVCGALPSNGPVDLWKFIFKYIYGAFFQSLLSPSAKYYNVVIAESEQYPDAERIKLFNTADLRPMWDNFRRSVKSITTYAFMWEWEHGSVAPKKAPPPGWRKMKEKAPKS